MEYQPWHLKYRPQLLKELTGHSLVTRTLSNAIKERKISNAYLFEGKSGTGKTSTARIFAKSLNCRESAKPTLMPCGKCLNCRSIEAVSSLDVLEVDAASKNKVEDIREIIDLAQLFPVNSRYKVFIIDEAQMLTRHAQNAFLKTLEEATPQIVFVLATTEKEKLLRTIIGRCLHLEFSQLTRPDIVSRLKQICSKEKVKASEDALALIAQSCRGGMRDAIQLLEKLSISQREIAVEDVKEATGAIPTEKLLLILNSLFGGETTGIHRLLRISSELISQGKEPKKILAEILEIYRDLLQLCLIADSSPTVESEEIVLTSSISLEHLQKIVQMTSWRQLELGLEALEKAEREIELSPSPVAWLDIFFIRLAKLGMF
ncbi:MAG TPA: DNA polymerase III, subunit gamma and tau [Cyanobacteria bacterium UBA8543]|nr:DNA polymerase III, subunit gamma and tau [Cyanobacteria bacterium UBA8543]